MSEATIGRHTWTFAAGHLPDGSTGHEPEFTSRDELCVINASDQDACLHITVYYTDTDPTGPYEIRVPARRLRCRRINGLIDPQPVPLGVPYGLTVSSDVPVVVQLRHVDTRQAELGVAITSGFATDP